MKKTIITSILAFTIQNNTNAAVVASHSASHSASHTASHVAISAARINNNTPKNNVNQAIIKQDTFSECYYSRKYYKNVAREFCNIQYHSDQYAFNGMSLNFGELEDTKGKFSNLSGIALKKQQISCFKQYCNL